MVAESKEMGMTSLWKEELELCLGKQELKLVTRQLEMLRKQTDTRVIRSGVTYREVIQKVNQDQG